MKEIRGYHAHVYYSEPTRAEASWIREELAARFPVELGRWRDEPVGPHPSAMYQVKFDLETFGTLLPWLSLNHRGLSVLIHPRTGEDLLDHTENALWLGPQLALRTDVFDD
ncbi:MAG: DOPA 4,5-dioxygenase family protein [Myxococcales bacterium]|nr:DOPA 4,5-dioxygenase family protein [Myxococcales bacterium]